MNEYKGVEVKFILKEHQMPHSNKVHHDFRFEQPDGDKLKSFALPKGMPSQPGEKLMAIQTPLHEDMFMDPPEYFKTGKGWSRYIVKDRGTLKITTYDRRMISFFIRGDVYTGHYTMICISLPRDDKTWLIFKNEKYIGDNNDQI